MSIKNPKYAPVDDYGDDNDVLRKRAADISKQRVKDANDITKNNFIDVKIDDRTGKITPNVDTSKLFAKVPNIKRPKK